MTNTNQGSNVFADFLGGFLSIFKGMAVTWRNLVGREKITVQYPYERAPISPRYRGIFFLPYDAEAHRLKCVGCTLCAQACPTNVISMTKLGAGKHAGVSDFTMDLGRCMFCNLCIEACPFDAIYMGQSYEIASYDRDASVLDIRKLAVGGAQAVETNNATITAALAEEAAAKAAKANGAAAHGAHGAPAKPAAAEAAKEPVKEEAQ